MLARQELYLSLPVDPIVSALLRSHNPARLAIYAAKRVDTPFVVPFKIPDAASLGEELSKQLIARYPSFRAPYKASTLCDRPSS